MICILLQFDNVTITIGCIEKSEKIFNRAGLTEILCYIRNGLNRFLAVFLYFIYENDDLILNIWFDNQMSILC